MKNMLAPKMFFGVLAAAALTVLAVGSVGSSVNAADLWWDNSGGTANSWGDVNNWSTTVGGGSTPVAIPGGSDVARFSATPIVGTPQTVNLNGSQSVQGIAVESTVSQAITFLGGGTNQTLTIGSSGVTNASNVSAFFTIGSGTAGQNVNVTLAGSQSWANNGSQLILVRNNVSGTGTPTFTNNGTGSGAVQFQGNIGGSVGKIVQDSATSSLRPRGQNFFTGGVEVKQGVLFFGSSSNNLGTGTLTLGVNGGTGAVTAEVGDNNDVSFSNAIVLASGHTGPITILMTEDSGSVNSKTFAGGITGTNSFTIQNDGGNDNLNFNTGSINNAGTITHTGTGTGLTTINAVIGSNVTGLTQNGPATLELNAANTHGGTTAVSGGTLRLGNVNALQNSTLDTGTSGSQQVTFVSAGTYNIGGLSGADALAIGANSLSVGANNQNTTYSGAISGAGGALTKAGTGTLTLTGSNTFTGSTGVSGGRLLVTGALGNTAVSVTGSGALGGTGSLGGSLSFAASSAFEIMDFLDPLSVTGSTTFASGFGVANLTGFSWDALDLDTPYAVLATTQQFSLADISNFGLAARAPVGTASREAYFTSEPSGGLQLVVVPEPGTLPLAGLGVAAAAWLVRRRGLGRKSR